MLCITGGWSIDSDRARFDNNRNLKMLAIVEVARAVSYEWRTPECRARLKGKIFTISLDIIAKLGKIWCILDAYKILSCLWGVKLCLSFNATSNFKMYCSLGIILKKCYWIRYIIFEPCLSFYCLRVLWSLVSKVIHILHRSGWAPSTPNNNFVGHLIRTKGWHLFIRLRRNRTSLVFGIPWILR